MKKREERVNYKGIMWNLLRISNQTKAQVVPLPERVPKRKREFRRKKIWANLSLFLTLAKS